MKYGIEEKTKLVDDVIGLASSMSVAKACKQSGVPMSSFLLWVNSDKEAHDCYVHARADYIGGLADKMLEVADEDIPETDRGTLDNAAVQRNKLRVDTLKWLLSKLAPKLYGERLTVAGDADSPLTIQKVERVIVELPTKVIEE